MKRRSERLPTNANAHSGMAFNTNVDYAMRRHLRPAMSYVNAYVVAEAYHAINPRMWYIDCMSAYHIACDNGIVFG